MLSYDDYSNYFTGKVNVGVVLIMNAPLAFYQLQYRKKLAGQISAFRALHGKVQILTSCDTLQVNDYSKFSMGSFNEAHKKAHREKQFSRIWKKPGSAVILIIHPAMNPSENQRGQDDTDDDQRTGTSERGEKPV